MALPALRLQRQTRQGLLVALDLPESEDGRRSLIDALHPDETRLTEPFAQRRLLTYAGGRFVMREALKLVGIDSSDPIVQDVRGAPVLPPGVAGSISHKDDVACALVKIDAVGKLGVDVETIGAASQNIVPRIMTDDEQRTYEQLSTGKKDLMLAQCFSLKEALYKALDPFVRRYVGFREVQVLPKADGTARFELSLEKGEKPFVVQGDWFVDDSLLFSSVSVA